MRKIIDVTIKTRKCGLSDCKTDLLAVGVLQDAKKPDKSLAGLDKKLGGAVKRVLELEDFSGKAGSSHIIYGAEGHSTSRVMLIGLGKAEKADLAVLRKAASQAANKAVDLKVKTVSLALHQVLGKKVQPEKAAQAMAEGAHFGSYRYDEFVSKSKDKPDRLDSLTVEIIEADNEARKKLDSGADIGDIIGRSQSYARTVANRPANVINPVTLAQEARKMARSVEGLSCSVWDEKKLRQNGMGGMMAVGAGSKTPPRFIVFRYNGGKAKSAKIVLVGKAITFDSGGISIKPSGGMDEMKFDKTGGITVLGTMKAVAELKLPINVIGIICAAENMPGSKSYRPGDIIETYSKKTVEVLNTDAEGRMVLADGLHWATQQKPDAIVDLATLTGACVVALGKHKAAVMTNDDELGKKLQEAAKRSGEPLWPLPCDDEYAEDMKSKIADLKNIGPRWGGACTAAAFLRQFVGENKWAHLDIAGKLSQEKPTAYAKQGSVGFGVRLLCEYLLEAGGN